jgi:hypothetical protein
MKKRNYGANNDAIKCTELHSLLVFSTLDPEGERPGEEAYQRKKNVRREMLKNLCITTKA